MASGFIKINKENTFAIRWTSFDEIIKIIIRELKALKPDKKASELIEKLEFHIPPYNLEDELEMGWGFIDERIDGTTSRSIDFNKIDKELVSLFWKASENGYKKLTELGTEYSRIHPKYMKELIDFSKS